MHITSIKMLVVLLGLNLLMLTDLGGVILTISLMSIIGIPLALGLMALPSLTFYYGIIFVLEHLGRIQLSRSQLIMMAFGLLVFGFAIGQTTGHLAFLPHIALERMMSSDMQFYWWLDPF